jgi:hypothetical protein
MFVRRLLGLAVVGGGSTLLLGGPVKEVMLQFPVLEHRARSLIGLTLQGA